MPWIPILYKQIGWMPCAACSDAHKMKFGQKKGQMWLGRKPNGLDDFVNCPACGGKGEVARYKILDARTGEEIDYEYFGKDKDGNVIPPSSAENVIPISGAILDASGNPIQPIEYD